MSPVVGDELRRVELDLALLQVPVGPHRQVVGDRAVGLADVEPVREAEHRPQRRDPGADGDDDLLDRDRRLGSVCTTVTAPDSSNSKPVTSTPGKIWAPAARARSARPNIDSRLKA